MSIEIGQYVVARVSIMGAKRGTGWRYASYKRIKSKSGFKFNEYLSSGMYPNKYNAEWSKQYEDRQRKAGFQIIYGRPDIRNFDNF